MAMTLADVVFRRTDMATGGYPGRTALRRCADLMAGEFGWGIDEIEAQIDRVVSRFPTWAVERIDGSQHDASMPLMAG
ncbi:MAG: hypothetical protein MI741_14160, partial [Rhodospirillales bacterium]|nr:hypothetical protein [Rhodospirillales bacterium]